MPECSLPLLLFPPFPRHHNADSDVLRWEERCTEHSPTLSDDAAIFPSVGRDRAWDLKEEGSKLRPGVSNAKVHLDETPQFECF